MELFLVSLFTTFCHAALWKRHLIPESFHRLHSTHNWNLNSAQEKEGIQTWAKTVAAYSLWVPHPNQEHSVIQLWDGADPSPFLLTLGSCFSSVTVAEWTLLKGIVQPQLLQQVQVSQPGQCKKTQRWWKKGARRYRVSAKGRREQNR